MRWSPGAEGRLHEEKDRLLRTGVHKDLGGSDVRIAAGNLLPQGGAAGALRVPQPLAAKAFRGTRLEGQEVLYAHGFAVRAAQEPGNGELVAGEKTLEGKRRQLHAEECTAGRKGRQHP